MIAHSSLKVLCTSPRKYTLVEAEGIIRSRCCVDVVVRHGDICINNEGVTDKFRIQVTEHGQRKILGRKDVNAVLLPTRGRESSPSKEDKFHTMPRSNQPVDTPTSPQSTKERSKSSSGPSLVVILAAVMCIVALMLPQTGDTESRLPEYLHLTVNQKLIAAYVLGLVTMLILHV